MTTWLSDASANRHIKTYVKDFLDVSGNMTVRQTDDYAWNAYGQVISGRYESDATTYLGIGVGMDVSGLTMVVGAPGQDGANTTSTKDGSVIVYRYDTNAEIWYQLGNTILGETDNYDFGLNVDINDAGTRIMATNHTTGDFVNVYDYNSETNTWDKQVSITAHTISRYAGRISGDGNTIIFGDYTDNSNTGKQYVYRNTSGTTWTLIGEFTGSHTNVYAAFGPSLSYDGNRVTFPEGDYNFDADGNSSEDHGRVTIYDYSGSGTTWNPVGNPLYGDGSKFSHSTDFSKDGSIVAMGATNGYYAKVFQYDATVDGSWKQLGTTIRGPTDGTYAQGVRLSGDGTVLIVSDQSDDTAGTDNGALYIYKYTNGDWVQQGSTLYGQYTGAQLSYVYGNAVAISGDGTKIVAGGYLADVNSTNSGYVQSWQWSQKTYINPALDISGGTMTMWGGAEHMAANYSVTQLGADIDEYNDNGAGENERSNELHFSSDGTTLCIGHQLGYNKYSERTGTFRVMKYRNGGWYKIGSTVGPRESETGDLTDGGVTLSTTGLSSDGTRAMGNWKGSNGTTTGQKGLMRVYDLIDGDWVQVGNDITGDSAGDLIRNGIMSGDGNTVAYRDQNLTYSKIRTYNSSTNTWDLQTTITGSVTTKSLSYDGTIRVDSDSSTSGDYKTIVYKYAGGSWSQIGQELKSYEVADDESFNLANLSKYGDYLLVGDQESFTDTGVAIVYKYSSEGDIWMQLGGNIQNPFATESLFVSVGDISEDGKTIVLTDYLSRGSDEFQGNDGAIAVYKYFDGNWTEIFNYDGVEDSEQLGAGGAMSDNGELFAISSAGSFFARTYKITNNPALKIQDGKINDISVGAGSGTDSVAIGISPIASADGAIAMGLSALGSGTNSIAIGRAAVGQSENTIAIGISPIASADGAIAMGLSALGSGTNSIAIGRAAVGQSENTIAIGIYADASGSYDTAIGRYAYASGGLSIGIGANTNASGTQSVSLGYIATSSGACSVAIGRSASASMNYGLSIGYTAVSGQQSVSVGYLANSYHDSQAKQVAIGNQSNATGQQGTAVGGHSNAIGIQSVALGYACNATGAYSVAIGRSTQAATSNSTAVGYLANADTLEATAIGKGSKAHTSTYPTAIGGSSNAYGGQSVALGFSTKAGGYRSVAIGAYANTAEANTIALGTTTMATSIGHSTHKGKFSILDNQSGSDSRYYMIFDANYAGFEVARGSSDWSASLGRVKTSFSSGSGEINLYNSSNNYWIIRNLYSNHHLYFLYNGAERGYLVPGSNVAQIDFTGQHRGFVENIHISEGEQHEGLIVCANKNEYFDVNEELTRGIDAIQISQSLPYTSLCRKDNDKTCYGVISLTEDEDSRTYEQGSFGTKIDKQHGDNRFYINSVGEGAMWVCNKNGSLESGDYITSASVPGYGQLQNDDILHNYTVAKITMDCDFAPPLESKKQIKREQIDFFQDISGDYWLDASGNAYHNPGANYFEDASGNRVFYDKQGKSIYTFDETRNESPVVYDLSQNQLQYAPKNCYHSTTLELLYGYRLEDKSDGTYELPYSGIYKNPKYNLTFDESNNLIDVTSNILDEYRELQWEDSEEQERKYKIRYVDASANILTEEEYNTKKTAGEDVYIAAFVGCTYHCG